MVIKLIKSETEILYITDILKVKINKTAKLVEITDTAGNLESITYGDKELFSLLCQTIEMSLMNEVSVDVYVNEADYKKQLESEAKSVRQPGENPKI